MRNKAGIMQNLFKVRVEYASHGIKHLKHYARNLRFNQIDLSDRKGCPLVMEYMY